MTSGLGATVTVDATADLTRAVRTACPDGVDAVAGLVSDEPGSFAGYAALARPGGLAVSARLGAGAVALPGEVEGVGFRLHCTPRRRCSTPSPRRRFAADAAGGAAREEPAAGPSSSSDQGAVMKDEQIIDDIGALVEEERALRDHSIRQGGLDPDRQARLKEVEIRLDQCWDLLRRRRAKSEFGGDPDTAQVQPADEVENYES
ncbi:hypothetical protein QFZ82_004062 [Streptomyces sp. V4I23]|nr:hypothetical protein [Streptomyces sp. V4I23]